MKLTDTLIEVALLTENPTAETIAIYAACVAAIRECIRDCMCSEARSDFYTLDCYAERYLHEAACRGDMAECGLRFEIGSFESCDGNPHPFTLGAADVAPFLA